MTAQELLREAARNIDAALTQLDTHSTDCPTCARKHFRNLTHARTHEQLADLPERLRRAAEKVEQAATIDPNGRLSPLDLESVLRRAHVAIPSGFLDRDVPGLPALVTLAQLEYVIGAAIAAAVQPRTPPQ